MTNNHYPTTKLLDPEIFRAHVDEATAKIAILGTAIAGAVLILGTFLF